MRQFIAKFVVILLLIAAFGYSSTTLIAAQTTDTRTGSFTTDRGSNVDVEMSLEHEGGSPPTLETNKAYSLMIDITLNKLANDTLDIHDMEFTISISTSSLLGSGKQIYSGYFFDSVTELTEAGDSKSYDFTIYITGDL